MLFSPSCQCYKLNYVLPRTKTGWQTISQNYNLETSTAQHFNTSTASKREGFISFGKKRYEVTEDTYTVHSLGLDFFNPSI